MNSTSKTIVFSLSRGWYRRLFLSSGVVQRLLERPGYRVLILIPDETDDSMLSEVRDHPRLFIEPQYTVRGLSNGDRFYRKGVYSLWRQRRLYEQWLRTERLLTRTSVYKDLFARYRPDLVVTASAGLHSSNELPLIREAEGQGIPTLCVVWSWDNLAMKGPLPTRPGTLAVWNERMLDEAVNEHYYPAEAVHVTGVPQFDLYFNEETFVSREKFCEEIGFDPARPILLLATASRQGVADHRFLAKLLVDAITNGTYGQAQLLCRVHPMEAEDLYSEFQGLPSTRFEYPGQTVQGLGWSPDRAEDLHLANTLRHSDVVINIASTISVEAAVLDRPIINVAFSTSEPERFAKVVLKNHYEAHYRYIVESGATSIVRSADELHAAVRAYLENPGLHAQERARLAEALCFRLDGKAGKRVEDLIVSQVEDSVGP